MQVTITAISRETKTSKAGKPYTSLRIKTEEYGEKSLAGFGNKDNAHWKEGDKVEISVTERRVDDKVYYNFETTPAQKPQATAVDVRLNFMAQDIKTIKDILLKLGHKAGVLDPKQSLAHAQSLEPKEITWDPNPATEDTREVPEDVPW